MEMLNGIDSNESVIVTHGIIIARRRSAAALPAMMPMLTPRPTAGPSHVCRAPGPGPGPGSAGHCRRLPVAHTEPGPL